ncbi:MAG: hypothetical protein IJB73_08595 [Firmicutes bacterium]|nr:hypothetical protein [Bacillota bacterium]
MVLEVEVDDTVAAYILMDRIREANANRKERRHNIKLEALHQEDERF